MKASLVSTMASGPLPDGTGLKFFFYASQAAEVDLLGGGGGDKVLYLVQMTILASGDVSVVIKTNGSPSVAQQALPAILTAALGAFEPRRH